MPEIDDDVLVRVENVSKRFCRSLKRSLWYGLQDLGSELGGRRHGGGKGLPQSSADIQLRPDEFWAVKDVSFELRRGECLGLIGRNGAGKTTLLRMLNGLIKPDTGTIEVTGRVGALIALTAGFNPVLTGRENAVVNASILGAQKDNARDLIDKIVEFSGLEAFIDSPVQSYSSGMQVRLGFAISALLTPDILFLDEVLAVGDDYFQAKCWNQIGKLRRDGTSIILVSHQISNITRLASKVLYLREGAMQGGYCKEENISAYRKEGRNNPSNFKDLAEPPKGSGRIRITNIAIKGSHLGKIDKVRSRRCEHHRFSIEIENREDVLLEYILEIKLSDAEGLITQFNNESYGKSLVAKPGPSVASILIPSLDLNQNDAIVSISIWNSERTELFDWAKDHHITYDGNTAVAGRCYLPVIWQ